MSTNTSVKEELLKLANDRLLESENRKVELSKLAGGRMDRNYLDSERKKAIKSHEKARKLFTDLSSQLGDLQSMVERAQSDMNSAKDSMIDLNKIIQVMDLIGATDAKKEKNGDCSYTVDGQRMYADTKDFMNIRLIPWKDKDSDMSYDDDEPTDLVQEMRSEHSERSEGSEDPLSFIPDDDEDDEDDEEEKYASIESTLITKVAKKFR